MASNDYDIVNLALVRLGAKRITSLTDGSRNADEANAIYALVRDEVLRAHEWNFATRVADLEAHVANVLTITNATQASPCVITYTGTDPEEGSEYKIEDVTGMTELNDNTYNLQNIDTSNNTAELFDPDDGTKVDASAYTAYSSGGTATEKILHPTHGQTDWDYVFVLPPSTLRVIEINEEPDSDFQIITGNNSLHGYLYYNEAAAEIRYIYQETDVTVYDATFVDAFAWRLAMELAMVLTGDIKKVRMAERAYHFTMAHAKTINSKEFSPEEDTYDRYKNARR